MSRWYGDFKMTTDTATVYTEKLSGLVDKVPESKIISVYEYNHTARKYEPNESAREWLCQKRGQEFVPAKPVEDGPFAKEFREMRELMDEMGYTPEERATSIDSFIGNLPLKMKE